MKKILVEGVIENVVTTALVEFRDDLAKLKKKLTKKGLDTHEAEQHDAAAADLLSQLGWKPTPKGRGSNAEVVDDNLPLPFGEKSGAPAAPVSRAKIHCKGPECTRLFAVPPGDHLRACPDCGAVHRVKSDEDGTIHFEKLLQQPPDEILQLMLRAKSEDLAPLTKLEEKRLQKWVREHPDHVANAELVVRGERCADPDMPGSGNPLRIDCSRIAGTSCAGFDSTDTPGASVCPSCGHKYVVSIELDGKVLVRPWVDGPGEDGG